ncbi:MAG: exodeoxyribonuclease V subunit alpha [Desulfuromonadaceae bacterium]|nr:exodeoxyribonuclease V subunit alpha [Desulfuromonadaceae bacterium]
MDFELSSTDRHFAAFIMREAEHATPWLGRVAALASHAVASGNICLNLAEIAAAEISLDGSEHHVPKLEKLFEQLSGTQVVGVPGEYKPLILDPDGRLYLYRYWKYEHDLARILLDKACSPVGDVDEELLASGIQRLFPSRPEAGIDWQKIAAVTAVRKRFCVISGGPGTGKTSTVVKIIALLLEQVSPGPLRIALAAPTGKAAARLKESIRGMKESLDCSRATKDLIPEDVSTIHRLLGVRSGSVRFRHNGDNPLPHDVVIIDEASMVAAPLMAKLALALAPAARLILLGDRDQLASVEAGAVLGDICAGNRSVGTSPECAGFIARVTGEAVPQQPDVISDGVISDSLVVLQWNYRFGAGKGIGAVSRAVNAGEGKSAHALLTGGSGSGCCWHDIPKPDGLKNALAEQIVSGYAAYPDAGSPAEVLKRFDRFRILCALRQGPYGVAGVNLLVEEILGEKGLIERHSRWYPGRPVMITVNDYSLKLFNGDIGIVLPDPDHGGNPRVWFAASDGGVRSVSPLRLPAHETVYAMTVHKSQGSEFDQVLMLLPDRDSEALTRELIYTGITRARSTVDVWADEAVFCAAVARRINRTSGLAAALWERRNSD